MSVHNSVVKLVPSGTRLGHVYILQLPDGANAMIIGEMGDLGEPLLFVGGNCAIQGFDYTGEDKFWTVSLILVSILS